MSEREAFEHILASLHEAALDDTRWSTASALIDDFLGAHGNSLGIVDVHSGEDIQIYFAGFFYHGQRHREWEREYFDVYYPLDERVPRLGHLPDSKLVHTADLFTEEELKNLRSIQRLFDPFARPEQHQRAPGWTQRLKHCLGCPRSG